MHLGICWEDSLAVRGNWQVCKRIQTDIRHRSPAADSRKWQSHATASVKCLLSMNSSSNAMFFLRWQLYCSQSRTTWIQLICVWSLKVQTRLQRRWNSWLADFSCFFLRRCCLSAPCEVCVNGGVHVSTCRGGERWKVAGKSSLSTGAVLETSGWTHDAVLANLLRQQKALQELRGWRQEKRKKRRKEKLTEWNRGHVTLYTSTICWHGEHQTLCRSFLFVLTLLN